MAEIFDLIQTLSKHKIVILTACLIKFRMGLIKIGPSDVNKEKFFKLFYPIWGYVFTAFTVHNK